MSDETIQAAPRGGDRDSQQTNAAGSEPLPAARSRARIAARVLLVLTLVVTLPATAIGFTPVGGWLGFSLERTSRAEAAGLDGPAAGGYDLRSGGVFAQSNDGRGNAVVAFARDAAGRLREVGRYPTGGMGSNSFEDSSQAMVLGTAAGELAPTRVVDTAELLFVPNAGSNTISVFKVEARGLRLVEKAFSGGEKPVSLTVRNGLLYVLNSGEFDDRLIVGPTSLLENCGHGQLPSVTGFRVARDGALTQIENSTRMLTGAATAGCAQVSFAPDGRTLVVSERIGLEKAAAGRPKGALLAFPVRRDGTLGVMNLVRPTGNGPFGFTFAKDGTLLTTEQNGAFANPGGGTVASYRVDENAMLHPIGGSVPTFTTDPCWLVLTNDQRLAFSSSVAGGGAITSFAVEKDGRLRVLHRVASADDGRDPVADHTVDGLTDLSLSRDGRYLYQLNSFAGLIYAFRVNRNGTLTFLERHEVFQLKPPFMGGEGAPFGLVAV